MTDFCNCEGRRGFIQSGRFNGSDGSGSETISICLQCGKIHIAGQRNGEHFAISFHILLPEQLRVVGNYARMLAGELFKESLMYHPFPDDRANAIEQAQTYISQNPLFLDTETTGLSDMHEICEIAIVDMEGQALINTLVKPSRPIDPSASDIHGITEEMVAAAPTIRDLLPQLEQILRGRVVLIYNAEFDIAKLARSIAANDGVFMGEPWWWAGEAGSLWHCAMELYASFYGDWNEYHGSYTWQSLSSAALQCGIDLPLGTHRARADAEMTRRVILHLAEQEKDDQLSFLKEETKDE